MLNAIRCKKISALLLFRWLNWSPFAERRNYNIFLPERLLNGLSIITIRQSNVEVAINVAPGPLIRETY